MNITIAIIGITAAVIQLLLWLRAEMSLAYGYWPKAIGYLKASLACSLVAIICFIPTIWSLS